MSHFSDRPFVAGSMIGMRTFRIDKYGRLLASQLNAVWTPDENTARCFKDLVTGGGTFAAHIAAMQYQITSSAWMYSDPVSGGMLGRGRASAPKPPTPPPTPKVDVTKHRIGTLDCTCGFYAYFDDQANTYHHPGNLYGLVEGYGVVTVGHRGFRAEKARIKALVIKPKNATIHTDKVRTNYPKIPVFESKREALAEFPLTRPAPPSPELDLDFWTRETL